jgi:hypothetical protein
MSKKKRQKKIKQVDILGYTVPVVYKKIVQDEEDSFCAANFSETENAIEVDAKHYKESDELENTTNLLHETIHAAFSLGGWSRKFTLEEEEHITTFLANALSPVVKFR